MIKNVVFYLTLVPLLLILKWTLFNCESSFRRAEPSSIGHCRPYLFDRRRPSNVGTWIDLTPVFSQPSQLKRWRLPWKRFVRRKKHLHSEKAKLLFNVLHPDVREYSIIVHASECTLLKLMASLRMMKKEVVIFVGRRLQLKNIIIAQWSTVCEDRVQKDLFLVCHSWSR